MNLGLFPELDEEETRKSVSKFLTKDLERLLLMSGHNLLDLKSPVLSGAPGHSNGENHNEAAIIRGLNVEAMIKAIADTIAHCSDNSRKVLLGLFIYQQSWDEVQKNLFCEHNKLGYTRKKALYDFADSFDYWQRVNKCEPIVDLHKYK